MRWDLHVTNIVKRARQSLHTLMRLRGRISQCALQTIYETYTRPALEYASTTWSNLSVRDSDALERVQRRAARICLRLPLFQPAHHSGLLHRLHWPTLSSRRHLKQVLLAYDIQHSLVPPHIAEANIARLAPLVTYALRRPRAYSLPVTRTYRHRDSPINLATYRFNQLPSSVRNAPRTQFKQEVSALVESSICCCSSHPPTQSFA